MCSAPEVCPTDDDLPAGCRQAHSDLVGKLLGHRVLLFLDLEPSFLCKKRRVHQVDAVLCSRLKQPHQHSGFQRSGLTGGQLALILDGYGVGLPVGHLDGDLSDHHCRIKEGFNDILDLRCHKGYVHGESGWLAF